VVNIGGNVSSIVYQTGEFIVTGIQQAPTGARPSNPSSSCADVLLVTVTTVETKAVFDVAKERTGQEAQRVFEGNKTYYDLGIIGGARTWLVRSEMGAGGSGGALLTVADGIRLLSPDAVIMVGIAFGVDQDKQPIGKVLISQQILDYDLQKVGTASDGTTQIRIRGDRPQASPRLLDRFRDGEYGWDGAEPEFGLMLSGPKLIDNINFRNQLLGIEPETIGGEMEGVGLYGAAVANKVDWIMVKAVCDYADGHKRENKVERQKLAAQNAAGFVFHVIAQGGLVEVRASGDYTSEDMKLKISNQQSSPNSEEHGIIVSIEPRARTLQLTQKFAEYLASTGIEFAHRNRDHIYLDDLFVFPYLKIIDETIEEQRTLTTLEGFWEQSERTLVIGDEQSGKTSLAKQVFHYARSLGYNPILLNGSTINSSNVNEVIKKVIPGIYESISEQDYFKNEHLLCIVDDLWLANLRTKSLRKFLANLNQLFDRVILLTEESFRYIKLEFTELDEYFQAEILPFGNVCRSKLIEKWVELGTSEGVDQQTIYAKVDEFKITIDALVRKNIVPAKPIYLLMLLQSFEAITPQRLDLTSYGHCYQYLIYQSLERARVKPDEIETYINVLTELGGVLLNTSTETLDSSGLSTFLEFYSNKYLGVGMETIDNLIKSCILTHSDGNLKFRYRYLFYFYAAKYLSDSMSKGEDAKQRIQGLVQSIHTEKASNILLFLTHHSKDEWVIDEIILSVMELFSKEAESTLEANTLSFLEEFVKEIPDLILEQREAKQERLREDEFKDSVELYQKDENDDIGEDPTGFITEINKVFRAIEVCGQILRNRLGSLEIKSLELMYSESLSAALRFLSVIFNMTNHLRSEAIREIDELVAKNPKLTNIAIKKKVESFIVSLNYALVFAILLKVAYSLGSSKGREIYIKTARAKKTPASSLIQEIIELQFEKKIDISKLENMYKQFTGNPVCQRLLKQIVIRHCYMHDVDYRERQQVSSKLGIQIQPRLPKKG
jgi:nucleoside phosphorylase